MLRSMVWTTSAAVLLAMGGVVLADATSDPKATLATKGLKVLSTGVQLEDENELAQMLKDASRLSRAVRDAEAKQAQGDKAMNDRNKMIAMMTQERVTLQAQYNQTNNIGTQNRIVARLGELSDRIGLMLDDETLPKQVTAARGEANKAREAYIQHVLDMQKLAEKIRQQYVTLGADPDVKAALEEYNKQNNKEFQVAESRSFQSNLKLLKKMEDTVLTDSIQMDRDGGQTFSVSTVLNGKYSKDLTLDSGASCLCLPYAIAKEIGSEPGADAPRARFILADGSEVEAQMVTLEMVRVGRFEVDSVECAVMPPNLPNAAAILGMSFLRHFSFKIDSDTGLLTMSKVEGAR